ncbi:MAG TPA: GxxExxY protein [Chthoniobacterales bacterium]|nr:GxxExxY protein [Chthoniobacterales bacterium]
MNRNYLTTESTETTKLEKGVNELTEIVIGCAIEVHRAFGPGLLESGYEICLCRELSLRNLPFECQKPLPLTYKGVNLDCGYRANVIVDRRVLVEVKSVDELAPIHDAQLLSYLKLSGLKVGLLINFNVRVLSHGLRRKVLGPPEEISL